eukprot:1161481-Pelagomonas_calceolata.AAC.3
MTAADSSGKQALHHVALCVVAPGLSLPGGKREQQHFFTIDCCTLLLRLSSAAHVSLVMMSVMMSGLPTVRPQARLYGVLNVHRK